MNVFQQKELQSLGSEARVLVLALTSYLTLHNPFDYTSVEFLPLKIGYAKG